MAQLGTTPAKIAVLGADGFIGSAVTRLALSHGVEVSAVCLKEPWRLRDVGDDPRLELINGVQNWWWEPQFTDRVEPVVRAASATILLAYCPPSGSPSPLAEEMETNVEGARVIAKLVSRFGRRLVFTSSADVYGAWHDELVDEGVEPQPETPYAKAKLAAEQQLRSIAPAETVVLRLATVHGPGENRHRAIPSFIRSLQSEGDAVLHGDGSDVRDYIHVDDVAAAVIEACGARSRPCVVNIGSGTGRSTRSVLEAVARTVGVPAHARSVPSPRQPSRLVLNPGLAQRELGLRPRRDFDAAIAVEAEWLQAHVAETVA